MNRYENMFGLLREKNERAFIPFLVIGYPDRDDFLALIDTFVANGADALELGIAFSDPVADGLTIQQAAQHVLANNVGVDDAFALLEIIRAKYPALPIGLLVYANIVHSVEGFSDKCKKADIDSVLIADLPVQETALESIVSKLPCSVHIVPPNADEETIKLIAQRSGGYVYVTSRSGVTGADAKVELDSHTIEVLAKYKSAPPVLGFGVSQPMHVRAAVDAGFSGVIVGSALINLISQNMTDKASLQATVGRYISEMKGNTKL